MIRYRLTLNGGEPQIVEDACALDAIDTARDRLGLLHIDVQSLSVEPADASPRSSDGYDAIQHIKAHWFTQGGEAQFGSIDEASNADEVVAAILHLVRAKYNPPSEVAPGSQGERVMGTSALVPLPGATSGGWLPIASAPKDGTEVWLLTPEGPDIGNYQEYESCAPDDPGHDAGWLGVKHAQPGCTHIRRESTYWHEAQAQPTHWMPIADAPEAEDRDDG